MHEASQRLPSVYVERVGSVYLDASEAGQQADLKAQVTEQCSRRYRRIDRFTQLALLGAARCAGALELDSDTPLYLASGKGPASNNIEMQRAIIAEHEPAKPIQFINAVSNSVSFYLMQDHALTGQTLLVSREYHAFEAALTLLRIDLSARRSTTALLGMVDEITHPVQDQWARLGVARGTPLGEGSHWFLCHSERHPESLGALVQNLVFYAQADLLQWLASIEPTGEVFIAPVHGAGKLAETTPRLPSHIHNSLSGRVERKGQEQLWDGQVAGAIAAFLVNEAGSAVPTTLVTISCDSEERYHVILAERY